MAVTEVVERSAGRKGSGELVKGKREYVRVMRAKVSDVNDGPAAVRAGTGVPRVGDVYAPSSGEFDTGAFCTKVEPAQVADTLDYWDVVCTYSSEVGEREQIAQNPLLRPAEISGSFARFQRAIEYDLDGSPLLNSAGDPFDPPIEVDDSRPTITIKRNEATLNYALLLAYKDAVNSDVFLGFAAGVVKVSGISFDGPHQENGVWFWSKTYEFELRPDGWRLRPLDQGLRESVVGGNNREIRSAIGQPVSRPVPLDGNGNELAAGADPVFLEYVAYPDLPFAALSLP